MKTSSDCLHQRAAVPFQTLVCSAGRSCVLLLLSIIQQTLTTMIPMDHFPLEMLPNHQRDRYLLVWWSTPWFLSNLSVNHHIPDAVLLLLLLQFPFTSLDLGEKPNRDRKVVMFPFHIWLSCKQRYWTGLAETVLEAITTITTLSCTYNLLHSYVLNLWISSQKNISYPKVQLIFALGNSS